MDSKVPQDCLQQRDACYEIFLSGLTLRVIFKKSVRNL